MSGWQIEKSTSPAPRPKGEEAPEPQYEYHYDTRSGATKSKEIGSERESEGTTRNFFRPLRI